MARAMPKPLVPLPSRLPGAYCVFHYNRESETYSLILDNGEMSQYELGPDTIELRRRLIQYHPEAMEKGLDTATNFGGSQVIFSDGRVIPVTPTLEPHKREFDHGFTIGHDLRK